MPGSLGPSIDNFLLTSGKVYLGGVCFSINIPKGMGIGSFPLDGESLDGSGVSCSLLIGT